jgi:hypothetical protein
MTIAVTLRREEKRLVELIGFTLGSLSRKEMMNPYDNAALFVS